MSRSAGVLLLVALVGSAAPGAGRAESDLAIGFSGALSGGCGSSGRAMMAGIQAGLDEINKARGIHGRRLRLVALDDGFEPSDADQNMRALIDDHKVFALIGSVGSPAAVVSAQWAEERRVPLVAPMSGTRVLRRQPPDRYVLNLRPGLAEETETVVAGLVDELGVPPERVGFVTPADADGDAAINGLSRALRRRGYADLQRNAHGDYARCTLDVEDAVSRMLDSSNRPLAVVLLCTTETCVKVVKLARRERLGSILVVLSMADSDDLARQLGSEGEGVVVTRVVPPLDTDAAAARDFARAVPGPQGASSISFEGYLAARFLASGLQQAGPAANRESFVDALQRGSNVDLGVGPIFAQVVRQGRPRAFSWPALRGELGPPARALLHRQPGGGR